MIRYNSMPEIIVNLGPGLYLFDGESGSGKTYLCNTVMKLYEAGLPVVGYTYQDYLKHVDLGSLIRERKPELLVIDRYDQYMCDVGIVNAIRSIIDTAVVLVDVKASTFPSIGIPHTITLKLTPASIEVSL